MAEKKKNDIGKLGFEEAIESLTEIVNKIESGQTPLDSSLEQYERGMTLIKHCREILQAAEKRIEKIAVEDAKDDESQSDESKDEENELF